jgi:gliding motility-associated-like protein
MSDIIFSSAITPIEVSDSNQEIIPFNSDPGKITIAGIPPPALGMPTITNVNCFGQSTGSIALMVTGGSGQGFTYAWSNGMTTATISGLAAGSYSVTVSDIGSPLTATQTYTVTQPSAALMVTGQATAPSCSGGTDGMITTTVTGGTPPYSYAWTGGIPPNTPNPTGLPAGSYTVTVTDSRGCTATQTFTVPVGGQSSINIAAAVNNETCLGASDGSITLSVSGITGTPTYFWTPSTLSGSMVSNLAPGNYSVTVFDSGGCSRSQAFVITGATSALEITSIVPSPIENVNDGAVNITVAGGQSPYTYSWSGPGGFTSSSQNLSGLAEPGLYCVSVTDARNCVRTACTTVIRPLRVASANVQDACAGDTNGSIAVTVTGGVSPYTYNWGVTPPPANTSSMVDGLAPGLYFLTISDSDGEQIVVDFEVQATPAIVIAPNNPAVTGSPSNCNASIQLNASGGSGTLSYNWSTGATTSSIADLCLGTYCVTITDQRGCVKDTCFSVFFASPLEMPNIGVENTRCWDTEDGSLSIQIVGGLPPFVITVTNQDGLTLPPALTTNTTFQVNGLPAGTYTVEITDAQGESRTITDLEVIAPLPITAVVEDYRHDVFSESGCHGMIALGVSGGTGSYTVTWSGGGGGATGVVADELCGESYYQATIVDANGCTMTMEDSLFLSIFRVELVAVTGVTCPDDDEGGAELSVSGGDPGYTYQWTNAAGELVSEVQSPNNLIAGLYTVMVSEPSGNVVTLQVEIEAESMLGVALEVESDFNGFDVSCFNTADGQVRALASGSNNYIYEWIRLSDNMLVSTGATLTGAAAGAYQLQLSGADGCMITQAFNLAAPDTLRLAANVRDVSCVGSKDGSILVNAMGGIPGFGYSYAWSTGTVGNSISLQASGSYRVTVVDANGCQVEQAFSISEPAPLAVEFVVEPATDGCNGAIRATVASGTAPFSFNWLNIDRPINESVAINLCPGEYFLQVTDANGCLSTIASTIVEDRRFPCLEERVVITPNGDGANDQFIIFCIGDFPDNRLQVFNRWGQLVFEAENYNNNWEGTTRDGTPLPEGPYYYVLEFTDPEGNPVQQKGSLTILRGD